MRWDLYIEVKRGSYVTICFVLLGNRGGGVGKDKDRGTCVDYLHYRD